MKISFDLDGTYIGNETLFDLMTVRIKRSGGKVGILTGRPLTERITPGFIPDFELYLGTKYKNLKLPEICSKKAEAMKKEGIDLAFDDDANYFPDTQLALKITDYGN